MAKIGVLLTGGGTAGHIYPLLAVAEKLPPGTEIRYFGDPGEFREEFRKRGIGVSRIVSSKLRRYFSPLNFLDFFKFFWGVFQALWKIYWFMPNVAFSKGGPGALAVLVACRFYRIPIVIHESDSVPGRTNLISAKYARVIELGYEAAKEQLPPKTRGAAKVTGNPVRSEILVPGDAAQAKAIFGFDPKLPLLLVLGGSQGAEKLNEFILTSLEKLLGEIQILHQVGAGKYEEHRLAFETLYKNFSEVLKKRYVYAPYFSENMNAALDAADVILSRAGGQIFEIAAKGKPAILVPLSPAVVGEHQLRNAATYARTGAAIVIEEENLLPSILLSELRRIFGSPEEYKKMVVAAKTFYRADAASVIAKDIMDLAK